MRTNTRKLVRSRKKKNLLEVAGRIQFRKGFDHKSMRKLRKRSSSGRHDVP